MNGVSATPRAASRKSRKIPPSGGVLRFCTLSKRSLDILNKNAKQPESFSVRHIAEDGCELQKMKVNL